MKVYTYGVNLRDLEVFTSERDDAEDDEYMSNGEYATYNEDGIDDVYYESTVSYDHAKEKVLKTLSWLENSANACRQEIALYEENREDV
jgi:hypothetical protein